MAQLAQRACNDVREMGFVPLDCASPREQPWYSPETVLLHAGLAATGKCLFQDNGNSGKREAKVEKF